MTHLAPMIHPSHSLLPVRPPETVSMRTRDGVRLDADLYRPDAAGTWPVLLLRVPCGRRIALTSHYAHPRWYAARGYVVVVQDVRGCGTSDGRFRPFEAEREDGADAVAWAASLPGLRPLLKLSYALNWSLDPGPFGFQLVHLALHAANAVLAWRLLPL